MTTNERIALENLAIYIDRLMGFDVAFPTKSQSEAIRLGCAYIRKRIDPIVASDRRADVEKPVEKLKKRVDKRRAGGV